MDWHKIMPQGRTTPSTTCNPIVVASESWKAYAGARLDAGLIPRLDVRDPEPIGVRAIFRPTSRTCRSGATIRYDFRVDYLAGSALISLAARCPEGFDSAFASTPGIDQKTVAGLYRDGSLVPAD